MTVSLPRRIAAILYDLVLVMGVVFFAFALLYIPLAQIFDMDAVRGHWLWTAYILLVAASFHIGFWTHGGQTLGMKTWRIRLVAEDGGKVTLKQALIRYLVAMVSLAVFGLGFFWSLFDAHRRTWHDLASHTNLVTTE